MLILLVVFLPIVWGRCPSNTVCDQTFQKCYKYETRDASYFAAEEDCVSLGGHLTSIQNAFENALVGETADSMFDNYNDYWIGANYIINNKWSWTDGSPWQFTDWFPGDPSVQMVSSVVLKSHKWTSTDPDNSKPYVCELPYSQQVPVTCHPVAPVTCPTVFYPTAPACPRLPRCESGWTLFGGTNNCYKVEYKQNFWSAEEICKESGAHLASIHSEEENDFISNLATSGDPDYDVDTTYIGLYLAAGRWLWTDNSEVNYTKWGPTGVQPPSSNGNCGRVWTGGSAYPGNGNGRWDHKWLNEVCSTILRNFVCKKKAL